MATPQLQKAWTIYPNERRAYTTLIDQVGYFVYRNKLALLAAGWTVKWSCDGTTGPVNAADNTDRITDQTKFATRATIANAVQSFLVMQNVDGCHLVFSYMGASDDIFYIAFSELGTATLQATTTHRPSITTDEMILTTATSVVNATASADRVFHIWATSESWSSALYRAGSMQHYMGAEKIDSGVSTTIKTKPYLIYNVNDVSRAGTVGALCGGAQAAFPGTANWRGVACHHRFGGAYTVSKAAAGLMAGPSTQGISVQVTTNALANQPTLQNNAAMPVLPIFWFAQADAGRDGFIGSPIDWWWGWGINASTPSWGDMFPALDNVDTPADPARTNWLVAVGPMAIRPWRNIAVSYLIT